MGSPVKKQFLSVCLICPPPFSGAIAGPGSRGAAFDSRKFVRRVLERKMREKVDGNQALKELFQNMFYGGEMVYTGAFLYGQLKNRGRVIVKFLSGQAVVMCPSFSPESELK